MSNNAGSRVSLFGVLLGFAFLGLALCLAGSPLLAADDDTKPDAKPDEKKAPDLITPKPDDKKAPDLITPKSDENPILTLIDEVSSNMKTIEELLNQKNTGSDCQAAQSVAIQKLDELIVEMEKQACSSSSSSSSSKSGKRQQKSKDQKQSKKQQEMARKKQQQQQDSEPKDNREVPNNRTADGQMPPSDAEALRNREGTGRWGRLPKRDVEEMYDNGRRKLPEKYRILLEEYFGRLPRSK